MAKKTKSEGQEHDLLRIASFMLFDAMLFHLVLANSRPTVRSFDQRQKKTWKKFLREQWLHIRTDINYRPVFDLALEILDVLPVAPDTESILKTLADAAESAVASGILLKHDFVGRIYHKLLLATTGHYYATYYTSLPAAWLLAGFTFRAPHAEWKFEELEQVGDFSVIDPACGSGTLLSASYSAIRDLYILNSKQKVDLDTFHEVALSTTIHGWDVLDFAAHLSLTTLALHSDTVTAEHSNIYKMPLGANGSRAQLGSLEYLAKAVDLTGMALTEPTEELDFQGSREVELERRQYNVVIMNPPFSRSAKPNVMFGYSEADVRKRMQKGLADLSSDLGMVGASVAGLTPFFMVLGLRMLKPKGRAGMVVPRSILSGVASKEARKRYEAEAKIRYIVSNFDPGSRTEKVDGWCWSENTNLGEVLIVAEQEADNTARAKNRVTYVNVIHRPRNEVEALILSQEVIRVVAKGVSLDLMKGEYEHISAGETLKAFVYDVPQSVLRANWLAPCTFASPLLNAHLMNVLQTMKSKEFAKFLRVIDGEYATGRDIASVKTSFKSHPVVSDAKIVLGHQADMNSIQLDSKHTKHAKAKKKKAAVVFSKFASDLLIAERPHMSTEALLAMKNKDKVLTTAFWEVQVSKPAFEPWLLLWLNSTYGIMTFMAHSTSSQGDIFKMKKDQLNVLPVPEMPDATEAEAKALLAKLKGEKFLPYGEEFDRAAEKKGPRRMIDEFFETKLKLPKLIAAHYKALAADPAISKTKLTGSA